jgi:hypothetical protein
MNVWFNTLINAINPQFHVILEREWQCGYGDRPQLEAVPSKPAFLRGLDIEMLESPEGQLHSYNSWPADHIYPTGKEKTG